MAAETPTTLPALVARAQRLVGQVPAWVRDVDENNAARVQAPRHRVDHVLRLQQKPATSPSPA